MVGSFSPMEAWSHRKTTSTAAAAAVDGDGIPNWFRGFVADLKRIPTVVLVFSGGPRFGRNLRNKQRLGFFFFTFDLNHRKAVLRFKVQIRRYCLLPPPLPDQPLLLTACAIHSSALPHPSSTQSCFKSAFFVFSTYVFSTFAGFGFAGFGLA